MGGRTDPHWTDRWALVCWLIGFGSHFVTDWLHDRGRAHPSPSLGPGIPFRTETSPTLEITESTSTPEKRTGWEMKGGRGGH